MLVTVGGGYRVTVVGGYRVSYGSPLKMSSTARFYGGYTCEVKRDRVGL